MKLRITKKIHTSLQKRKSKFLFPTPMIQEKIQKFSMR